MFSSYLVNNGRGVGRFSPGRSADLSSQQDHPRARILHPASHALPDGMSGDGEQVHRWILPSGDNFI